MNKFRRLGFISYNGTIEVHRSLMNAVLSDKIKITKQAELERVWIDNFPSANISQFKAIHFSHGGNS